MQTLSPLRFGLAFGIAGVVFYVTCMLFMATMPDDSVVWLSNSLLHGVDIKSIMRENVPMTQALVGIICTFLGGLMFGALSAGIYNFGLGKNSGSSRDNS